MWLFTVVIVLFLSRESTADEATKATLLERQKEYKMAALRAKKQGDVEQARLYFKTSKVSKRLSDLCKTKTVSPVHKFVSAVSSTKQRSVCGLQELYSQ